MVGKKKIQVCTGLFCREDMFTAVAHVCSFVQYNNTCTPRQLFKKVFFLTRRIKKLSKRKVDCRVELEALYIRQLSCKIAQTFFSRPDENMQTMQLNPILAYNSVHGRPKTKAGHAMPISRAHHTAQLYCNFRHAAWDQRDPNCDFCPYDWLLVCVCEWNEDPVSLRVTLPS